MAAAPARSPRRSRTTGSSRCRPRISPSRGRSTAARRRATSTCASAPAWPARRCRRSTDARQRQRDVGPRQLRRLAGAQAGLVDERRRRSAALYARQDADAKANPVKRGRYLVETLRLRRRATRRWTEQKRMLPGMRLAGGVLIRIEPLRRLSDRQPHVRQGDRPRQLDRRRDQARRSRKAFCRDGTRLLPFPMDWASFSTMTADDLNAIVAYLRTVPPVRTRSRRRAGHSCRSTCGASSRC